MEFEKELEAILDNLSFQQHEQGIKGSIPLTKYSSEAMQAIKQAVDTHVIGEDDKDKSDKAWIDFPVRIRNDVRKNQRKALWGKGEEQ